MSSIVALTLCAILTVTPARGTETDLLAAVQKAAKETEICRPTDTAFMAGRDAAERIVASISDILDADEIRALPPPADQLASVRAEDRHCWSEGWRSGLSDIDSAPASVARSEDGESLDGAVIYVLLGAVLALALVADQAENGE